MRGRIIKSISGEYTCLLEDDSQVVIKPKGIFRYHKLIPKVGDKIEVENGVITKIEDRKNDLIRPVVSNVDKVIIVTSVVEPDLNLNLLDRLICNSEFNDLECVLVFSKCDLVNDINSYDSVFEYYKGLGYKVYLLPDEYKEIREEINNNICVLAGQSGVGKSTFVNLMTDLNLKTGEISYALGRGKHTTRHNELINVNGGWIADTPGFGTMDLDMDEVSLSQTFKEMFECKCKFNPCLHLNEPGCCVKEKIQNKEILKSRYDNYVSFINEIRKKEKKKY